jgi:hypothetical protein
MISAKKGETVILHMFTGIAVGVKEILKADKKTITLNTRSGEAVFDRKTGFQIEPPAKAERYRNYVTEDDGTFEEEKKSAKKSKKKAAAKKSKKPAKKSKVDEDDFDDYDEAEEDED